MQVRRWHNLVWSLALLAPAAWGTTYTWPGTAPCASTLQSCINGVAAGSRIEIATLNPIDEDITIADKSLTLTAAVGINATFAHARHLVVTADPTGTAGTPNVSVSKLSFSDGYVLATYGGSATATWDFEDLTLTRVSNDVNNYIDIEGNNGTTNVTLINNRVSGVPASLNSGLINLYSGGATLNVNAYYNQVTSTSAAALPGAGIFVDLHSGAAGTLKLHGNTVRGGFYRGGIFVSEGLFSSTASNITARIYNNVSICADASSAGTGGTGLGLVANNGTIDVQAINNTISRCYDGIVASRWDGSTTPSMTGSIKNNLIVAYRGLEFVATLLSLPNEDYNLINATTSSIGYSSHDSTAPARLVLDTQPRLRPDSSAIDAADSATLGFGLIFNGLPTTDGDGLRRFLGATSKADIGAYEFGDATFTHIARPHTISGHVSEMDSELNGNNGALLLATPNFSVSGVANNHPFGTYYYGPWALFNQDFAAMPANTGFDIFSPAPGGGSFTHVTSAGSVSGYSSIFSDSSTDNLPDRIVLLTQNWTVGGSAVYNPHPVGVYYGSDSKWHVANLDGAAMPQNLGFNLYAQEPSPNAFRMKAATANDPSGAVRLDHPLLDNAPCARPQVTRLLGSALPGPDNFDIFYLAGKWYISGNAAAIGVGEQFHVLVDPRQVFDCTDRIFADAFGEDVSDF
jgi:hypothetical protein